MAGWLSQQNQSVAERTRFSTPAGTRLDRQCAEGRFRDLLPGHSRASHSALLERKPVTSSFLPSHCREYQPARGPLLVSEQAKLPAIDLRVPRSVLLMFLSAHLMTFRRS